ncbi:hypothetical protein PITC_087050 [Penicillium italicum]|uniref:Uncharacterized protein n=1 Tax=Penicillium italicum TaxID=40296 RepID=A0A0A2K8T3_PENIT|nr:hypothetical protein PITC_087050 [Penicillium italicum]
MVNPEGRFFFEARGYFGPEENPLTEAQCNFLD